MRRVLHLVSFDRWSGAVGPAYMDVEALRSAGHEAFFAYMGGYKLEEKLGGHAHAWPILERGHGPIPTWRSVRAIREVINSHHVELLHAHLSWDHQLAWMARPRGVKLVRTYHARRSVRRHLLGATEAVAVSNRALADHPLLRPRRPAFTPPAVDHRFFAPEGKRADLPTPVLGCIGKLAEGRGFEDALKAAAQIPEATLLVIGQGPHQPALARLARELGIAGRVVFAGYHEDGLPEYYRAMDLLLFTAKGSEEGHRAITEAMACGVVPVSYPFEGLEEILGELHPQLVAADMTADALSAAAARTLHRSRALSRQCIERTRQFGLAPTAARLLELYTSG
jgi:glycosyltransferase involved in cell wall biosynthesis